MHLSAISIRPAAAVTTLLLLVATASAQTSSSQRALNPLGPALPLAQFRTLSSLQRRSQQLNVEDLRDRLKLTDDQLHSLKRLMEQYRGMSRPEMEDRLRRWGISQPALLQRAADLQQQLQRLEETLPTRDPTRDPTGSPPGTPDKLPRVGPQSVTPPPTGSTSESPDLRTGSRSPSNRFPPPRPEPDLGGRPDEELQTPHRELGPRAPNTARSRFANPGSTVGRRTPNASGDKPASPKNGPTDAEVPDGQPDHAGPGFDLQQELSRRGLRRTLGRLIQDVRKDLESTESASVGAPDDSSNTSMWNQTISSAVDRLRDVALESVEQSRNRPSTEDTPSSTVGDSPFHSRADGSDLASTPPARSIPNANAPEPASETGNSTLSQFSESLSDPLTDRSAGVLFACLLLAGLLAGGWLATTRQVSHDQRRRPSLSVRPVSAGNIRSRQDVVRAYHWLTECMSPDAASWWHHRRAMESMTTSAPEHREAIQRLAMLYESARYEPPDAEFSEQQIQQARAAMAGCQS